MAAVCSYFGHSAVCKLQSFGKSSSHFLQTGEALHELGNWEMPGFCLKTDCYSEPKCVLDHFIPLGGDMFAHSSFAAVLT